MQSENNKTQNIALEFLRQGIPTVPMRISYEKDGDTKAKKMALKKWAAFQTQLPSETEIMENFRSPDTQIGIVCGKISGIVIIDIDIGASEENVKFLNSFSTLKVKTPSGGFHLYFKYPKNIEKIKSGDYLFGIGSHIDVKADGGLATVPPSKYPNGIEYKWEGEGFNREKIAELPQEILKMLIDKNKPSTSENRRQNIVQVLKGVSTGSRNMDMTSLIGTLLKRFPTNEWEDIVLPAFYAINQQNNPPLSQQELLQIYESISSKELSSRNATEKVIEELGNSMSFEELMNASFPTARFAVENLFETNTINMLSAPPHNSKTWVKLDVAISLASGRKLFGKFEVEQQGVLIINEEDTERLLQERCNMLMGEAENLPIYFYVQKGIKLEDKFIEKIIEEAKNKQVGFIIFDSLRSVHDAEENSSKEMQQIMNQLKKITKAGFTVLFTHHNRKKLRLGGNKDNSGEESRGSSAINAAIHGHLSCQEHEKDGQKSLLIFPQKLKAAEKSKPFELLIERNIEKNKINFVFKGEYNSQENEINRTEEKLLEIVDKSEFWLSRNDFEVMKVGGKTAIAMATRNLVRAGRIQTKNRKRVRELGVPIQTNEGAHNESLYFRITENTEEENQDLDELFPD